MSVSLKFKQFLSHTNPNRNFILCLCGFFVIFCSYLFAQSDILEKSYTTSDSSLDFFNQTTSKIVSNESFWQSSINFGIESVSNLDDMERVIQTLKQIVIEIDATPEQEQQIFEIIVPVSNEIKSIKEDLFQTQEKFKETLTADSADSEALEQLRTKGVNQFEQISKQWVSMIERVSRVLTAEQRQSIQDRINQPNQSNGWYHWRG